jgi:hypothetical protein
MRQALELAQNGVIGPVVLGRLYADLESLDFSRDVLERHEQVLQVLRVPSCGWTDLGTPKRVEETIRSLVRVRSPATPVQCATAAPYLDLASQKISHGAADTAARLNLRHAGGIDRLRSLTQARKV